MLKSVANFTLALLLSGTALPAIAVPIELQDASIQDVVRWYSQHTGTAIAIDPRVDGTLTAYAPDVPNDQLPDFFRGVLEANGYQLVPGDPPRVAPGEQQDNFMGQLDVPHTPQASRVLPVQHLRAQDLAPLVTAFLSQTTSGSVSPAKAQVLNASNSLLVSGPEKRLDALERLLPQLDVTRPQVLIRAVLFETTQGDTLDFGVSFGRARSGAGLAGGVNTNKLDTSLASPGGTFGIFDGNVLAVALNALRKDSHADILSTPQVLALSGERGKISVGQNVPFITGRVTGEAASVDSPFQTIERRDVGIRLDVTPVVTPGGLVVMDVFTSSDSIADSLTASDIVTNQRSINTTVQITSGQAVLLGGLISNESREQESSVPGLGDIPLIGRLFRSTSDSHQRTRLYVLLQATVLPTQESTS